MIVWKIFGSKLQFPFHCSNLLFSQVPTQTDTESQW